MRLGKKTCMSATASYFNAPEAPSVSDSPSMAPPRSAHRINLPRERPSAKRFSERFAAHLVDRGCIEPERRDLQNALDRFLRWLSARPEHASREHARRFLAIMIMGGATRTQVRTARAALAIAFDDLCAHPLARSLRVPRPRALDAQALLPSPAQLARLLCAAPSLRDTSLLALLYTSVASTPELLRARWEDLDVERATLTLRDATGQPRLAEPLTPCLRPLLLDLRAHSNGSPWLFEAATARKGHLSVQTAKRIVRRAGVLALGSEGAALTLGSIKTAHATHLSARGFDRGFFDRSLSIHPLELSTYATPVDLTSDLTNAAPDLKFEAQITQPWSIAPLPTASLTAKISAPQSQAPPLQIRGIRLLRHGEDELLIRLPPAERWIGNRRLLDPPEATTRVLALVSQAGAGECLGVS